jgi:hypothetical protein
MYKINLNGPSKNKKTNSMEKIGKAYSNNTDDNTNGVA